MEKKLTRTAYCPVDYAFQRIGGKYKGRILYALKEEILRYGELKRTIEGITTKMLTQTLKELEADELVTRKVYLEVPPRVEYALSETGTELIPFIIQMSNWAEKQMAVK
jgi:DNA-binding HxlR family transcriptional regulator